MLKTAHAINAYAHNLTYKQAMSLPKTYAHPLEDQRMAYVSKRNALSLSTYDLAAELICLGAVSCNVPLL